MGTRRFPPAQTEAHDRPRSRLADNPRAANGAPPPAPARPPADPTRTLAALAGVHADDAQEGRTARDMPRIGVEPLHALIVIGVLVVALATSLTLLIQQSMHLASTADTSTAEPPSRSSLEDRPSSSAQPSAASTTQSDPTPSTSAPAPQTTQDDTAVATDQPIDLNTASQAQLETVKGIGPVTAANIIAYRTTVGRFSSVDDLINVQGIGAKTLEKIRPHVRV